VLSNTAASWTRNLARNRLYQLGSPILVPRQDTSNLFLVYSYDGNDFAVPVNLPRGVWLPGHVYIYNLMVRDVGSDTVVGDGHHLPARNMGSCDVVGDGSSILTTGLAVECLELGPLDSKGTVVPPFV
jgi:hypothetical protein